MNILFLAYNVNIHSRTGDAIHVRELALNIAELGNKVTLVVGSNFDSDEKISSLMDNTNIDVKYVKTPKLKYPRSRDVSILSLCRDIVKNNSFDIVYERNFSCRIGVILSKILRIPLVVEINGLVDEEAEMQGRHTNLIKSIIGRKVRNFFFRHTNMIIAVSPEIKKELIKQYDIPIKKIEVVSNGANIEIFKPLDKQIVQDELSLSNEFKYICFVGNLAPWQGVEYLINVAPFILKKIPEMKFLIVGDGIMKEKWEEMINNKSLSNDFIFVGSVPFETVPKYINASDICAAIFTNNRKCSPIKVLEYMACAKPVILNDIGDDTKIFVKSNSAFFVSVENPDRFANELYKIISNEDLKQIGTNGRKFILENYTWKNTVHKILEICAYEVNTNKVYGVSDDKN